MSERGTATGLIGLVQAFVNTADLEAGREELGDPASLDSWLRGHGLLADGGAAEPGDVKHALALREALRGIIGANTGGAVYPVDVATLNEASAASRLRARFGPDARARLEPEAAGVTGALGRIVAAAFAAMGEEDWTHLKLCGSPTCRWAFFDRSRNHSSRWCNMASCGNRAKARRFRQQRRGEQIQS